MVKIENHCVGCTTQGLHCIGSHCENLNVKVTYCDKCGFECDDVYSVDGKDLCLDCLREMFKKDE